MRLATKQLAKIFKENNAIIDEQLAELEAKQQALKEEMYVLEAKIARKKRVYNANIVRINFIEENEDIFK